VIDASHSTLRVEKIYDSEVAPIFERGLLFTFVSADLEVDCNEPVCLTIFAQTKVNAKPLSHARISRRLFTTFSGYIHSREAYTIYGGKSATQLSH
jgi:hypothetical protein